MRAFCGHAGGAVCGGGNDISYSVHGRTRRSGHTGRLSDCCWYRRRKSGRRVGGAVDAVRIGAADGASEDACDARAPRAVGTCRANQPLKRRRLRHHDC